MKSLVLLATLSHTFFHLSFLGTFTNFRDIFLHCQTMFLLIIKLFIEVVLSGAWPLDQLNWCLVLRKLYGAILTAKHCSEHL